MANNTNNMVANGAAQVAQKASPRSLNMVVLDGHLVADAKLVAGTDGRNTCFFRLAVNEGYLRRDGSNAASFVQCVIRDRRADGLAPHLQQGMKLTVTGSLSLRSNKLDDGQYSDSCMINVDNVFFGPQSQSQRERAAQQQNVQAQAQYQQAPVAAAPQYQQAPMAQQAPAPQYQQAPAQAQSAPQYQQAPVAQPAPTPQYQQAPAPQTPVAQAVATPQVQMPVAAPLQGAQDQTNPFVNAPMAQMPQEQAPQDIPFTFTANPWSNATTSPVYQQ